MVCLRAYMDVKQKLCELLKITRYIIIRGKVSKCILLHQYLHYEHNTTHTRRHEYTSHILFLSFRSLIIPSHKHVSWPCSSFSFCPRCRAVIICIIQWIVTRIKVCIILCIIQLSSSGKPSSGASSAGSGTSSSEQRGATAAQSTLGLLAGARRHRTPFGSRGLTALCQLAERVKGEARHPGPDHGCGGEPDQWGTYHGQHG